ncbi:MAG TPA: 5'-3' exonuclease H3TH domain-containing protein [Polyangiaceae bacterium]|nr:5'-3' exonuclease H3TH domain-containing protein [Polyangiaceae bacterium]
MNVYLVDGTYELFRAFYAVPSAKNSTGLEVGAVRGLARSMLALLREPGASHVAVAFDHVIESFRNQLFDGYKTGEGIDPDLWGQFELAERVCAALGIVVWPMVEFEADDALATAALRFAQVPEVTQVLIASPDKDLAQCVVGTRVVCLDRMRKKQLDEAGVSAKFGVTPAQIPDYLALVGDSADGIPGVPRWGAKSAAAVLREYGTIEAIPDSGAAWRVPVRGAAALAESLSERRVDALLYKRLATLRVDVPLLEDLADLRYRGALRAPLEALALELSDPALLERVPQFV